MSASNHVTAHKLYHAIVTVTRNISALSTAPGPDESLRSKATNMLWKLGKYWNPFGTNPEKMNKLVIVAGVLDPTKKMMVTSKLFEKLYGEDSVQVTLLKGEVEDILKSLFDQYNNRSSGSTGKSQGPSSQSQSHGPSSQSQTQSHDQLGEEVSQRTVLGNGLAYESMNDIYKELVQET